MLSSGTATFTLATTSLSSGNHIISAAYSGDSTYAGSKASVNVDVTSATVADFTLTPATATATAAAGATAAGTVFTVTPVNGFVGSVAFTATTTSSTLNAMYSFSVTPVVISSSTPGTTTLTLSAFVTNAKTGNQLLRLKPVGSATAIPPTPSGRTGWFAGSGAALACVVLIMVPRRRRFGALLGLVLSIGVLGGMTGLSGCGGGSSTVATPTTPATTNATPGTYTIVVAATGANAAGTQLTHDATVTFVVQ
jgi:hypothetical protein